MKNLSLCLLAVLIAYFGWSSYQQKQTNLPTQKVVFSITQAEQVNQARVMRQQKIAKIRQQIKDARTAIFENRPDSIASSPMFGDSLSKGSFERESVMKEQRAFVLNKQKEVRDLQKELDDLESGGTSK